MQNLSMLYLDDYALSGRLPPEISSLPLIAQNVSRNSISGPILSTIGQVGCLEILDLASNNLSGELPSSLSQLSKLSMLNVSYNPLLSGIVPAEGQFGTFDEQSFLVTHSYHFSKLMVGTLRQIKKLTFKEVE